MNRFRKDEDQNHETVKVGDKVVFQMGKAHPRLVLAEVVEVPPYWSDKPVRVRRTVTGRIKRGEFLKVS